MGVRLHGLGGVCGRHREHTFCSPANFLGDRRHGSRNLWHCPDGPSPEGEVLLPGMRTVVIRITSPRVAHPFDVEHGSGLAGQLYRRRGDLDARKACLAGNESHHSRVPEKSPPPLIVGVVIRHGVQVIFLSLATASNVTYSVARATPSFTSAATDATAPTDPSLRLCLSCWRCSCCVRR